MDNPLILENGNKHWLNKYGQFHREDGPAIETVDGFKCWYKNNKLHRLDGPAFEDPNGYRSYWKNGVKYNSLEELLMDNALE